MSTVSNSIKRETVQYGGKSWYRYPESVRRSDRVYYSCGKVRLHVQVWSDSHGPVPNGFHVHHKDENPENNALDNLEARPGHEHMRMHSSKPEHIAKVREYLPLAREAAKEWHGSERGLAWHRQHAADEGFGKTVCRQGDCVQCGKRFEYMDQPRKRPAIFCSNNCKSAHRRESGIDNETRKCLRCGTGFVVNKYWKNKYCSVSCGVRHSCFLRNAGLRPNS